MMCSSRYWPWQKHYRGTHEVATREQLYCNLAAGGRLRIPRLDDHTEGALAQPRRSARKHGSSSGTVSEQGNLQPGEKCRPCR